MAAPRVRKGATKAAPKKKTTRMNHKTPQAQAERDQIDRNILKLLAKKPYAEGLGKTRIAELLGNDATKVKASLNRLGQANKVIARGKTMDTVYLLPPKKDSAPAAA